MSHRNDDKILEAALKQAQPKKVWKGIVLFILIWPNKWEGVSPPGPLGSKVAVGVLHSTTTDLCIKINEFTLEMVVQQFFHLLLRRFEPGSLYLRIQCHYHLM